MKTWLPIALLILSACGRSEGRAPPEGLFVAVGDKGRTWVSEDGEHWDNSAAPTGQHLIHLSSGAGRFVAVGPKGTLVSSADGRVWTLCDTGTTTDLNAVAWNGERFIAVGGDGTNGAAALQSTDGLNWTALPAPSNQMFQGVVTRGDEVLVSSMLRSDLLTPALYRLNAGTFDRVADGPSFIHGLTDNLGVTYVVGSGSGARSHDGRAWETLKLDRAHALATSGSGFVAVGDVAEVFTSADGATWNASTIQSGAYFISGVAYGRGNYVAVAEPGFAIVGPEQTAANNRMTHLGEGGVNDVTFGPAN